MAKDKQVAEKGAAMTPDTAAPLGKEPRAHADECPARHFYGAACECGLQERYSRADAIADMLDDIGAYTQAKEVRAVFRRAERAEGLLQEAMHLHCLRDPDDELEVLRADVAAHFDQVKP